MGQTDRLTRSALGAWRGRVTHAAYDLLTTGLVWGALAPFERWRIARGRASRRDLDERLGEPTIEARGDRPRLIVHAVSAGEAIAAGAFVDALVDRRPDWSIVFTCGTRDGRAVIDRLRQRVPNIEAILWLPWDRPRAVRRWLRGLRADAFVVVEPEIWPGLFRACRELDVPLFLLNARVYPRDVWRYRRVRRFIGDALHVPGWIAARTDADRRALVAIGGPAETISVVGDLKFDAVVSAREAPSPMRDGSRLTIVAGSTHAPEEAWLLDGFRVLGARFAGLRLVMAPRDVGRAAGVLAAARARGLAAVLSSAADAPSTADVVVIDRVGELASTYALADVAFVGGTIAPKGGHNLLEPAHHGRAIVVGPHVAHVREVASDLRAAGGLVVLPTATKAGLTDAIGDLLDDPERRADLGERARRYHAMRAGAARTCAQVVTAAVDRSRAARHKTPVYVFGWPSSLGGADTKLAHLLVLLHDHYALTCVPNHDAQLHDREWTAFLDRLGVAYVPFDALPPRLAGVGLALCNDLFFTRQIAHRARDRGLRIVWSSEMMWHHPGELDAVRAGVVDTVVYASAFQRAALEPGYRAAAGEDVRSAIVGNYIDASCFPAAARSDETFTIGRLSRADPSKYPEDFPVFYERLPLPDARFRVMAWDAQLAEKYRWHRFDRRWDLLPAGAERPVDFLHSLDLFVYPLGAEFRESWGRSTVEAMLTGCVPLVPSGHQFEALLVDGQTGFICRDFVDWKERARQLYRDRALRRRMGADGRAHAIATLCNRDDHLQRWKGVLQ